MPVNPHYVPVVKELHGRRRRTFDRNPRGRQVVLQLRDHCPVLRRARTTAFVSGREPSILWCSVAHLATRLLQAPARPP
ncbi:hypothetical protein IE4803_PB00450 (plasmid) [Rhizobium etli bv. phaseoli str. IE4803]|nr:hypothetical protein IE4803_PB00450 [Rhizobium etli bv. phaseoli str. IE4803]